MQSDIPDSVREVLYQLAPPVISPEVVDLLNQAGDLRFLLEEAISAMSANLVESAFVAGINFQRDPSIIFNPQPK